MRGRSRRHPCRGLLRHDRLAGVVHDAHLGPHGHVDARREDLLGAHRGLRQGVDVDPGTPAARRRGGERELRGNRQVPERGELQVGVLATRVERLRDGCGDVRVESPPARERRRRPGLLRQYLRHQRVEQDGCERVAPGSGVR